MKFSSKPRWLLKLQALQVFEVALILLPAYGTARSILIPRQSLTNGTVTANTTSNSSSSAGPTFTAPVRTAFGLRPDGMSFGQTGISIGFLVDWVYENPQDVNKKLGKAAAIQGDYINVGNPSATSFPQIQYHTNAITRLAKTSVYAPAIIPSFPLTRWTDSLSHALADECLSLNKAGVTVWLRFGYEMNGYWMPYGLDPETFVSVWRSLTTIVRATTNETYMLWSPNIFGGDVNSNQGYTPYYPGAEYVDLAGLSFYSAGEDQRQNTAPSSNLFSSLFKPFSDLYADNHWLVISETSAPYHYHLPSQFQNLGIDAEIPRTELAQVFPTLSSTEGGDSELEMKEGWIQQLVGNSTATRFPKLLAVSWFNYVKTGNNSGSGLLNDFRAVADTDSDVTRYFRGLIGNETAFNSGYNGAAVGGASASRTLMGLTGLAFAFYVLC